MYPKLSSTNEMVVLVFFFEDHVQVFWVLYFDLISIENVESQSQVDGNNNSARHADKASRLKNKNHAEVL